MQSVTAAPGTCTFCGQALELSAAECPACGKSTVRARSASAWHAATPAAHFWTLWILSFGLYIVVWTFRGWKFLREEMQEDVHPHLRTALGLIPIVGQVLMFHLFKSILWFTTRSDGRAFGLVMFVWGMFAAGRLIGARFAELAELLFAIPAGAGVWLVQREMNAYYVAAAIPVRVRMPIYGWVICGFGALVWLGLVLELAGA